MSKRSAFTLIEMLVVMAIITVLAGMVLAGIKVVNSQKQKVITVTFMKQLEVSIGQYQQIYSFLPYTLSEGTTDDFLITETDTNGSASIDNSIDGLLSCLEGLDATSNPRKQKFLELDTNGKYNDAWANNFYVALDLTYDDQIHTDYVYGDGGSGLTRGIAIWSKGKDGLHNATDTDPSNEDNLNSWGTN